MRVRHPSLSVNICQHYPLSPASLSTRDTLTDASTLGHRLIHQLGIFDHDDDNDMRAAEMSDEMVRDCR